MHPNDSSMTWRRHDLEQEPWCRVEYCQRSEGCHPLANTNMLYGMHSNTERKVQHVLIGVRSNLGHDQAQPEGAASRGRTCRKATPFLGLALKRAMPCWKPFLYDFQDSNSCASRVLSPAPASAACISGSPCASGGKCDDWNAIQISLSVSMLIMLHSTLK